LCNGDYGIKEESELCGKKLFEKVKL